MTDTSEVLSRLTKKTRDRVNLANEIELIRLPLASTGLTEALNGGIGLGRQTLVWGCKSAGKSALVLQSMGMWQQMGYVCALFDVEDSFDSDWAERLGVDTTSLIVSKVKCSDDIVEQAIDMMENGVDIVAIDSITAIIPQQWIEKSGEIKGMDGTNGIGNQAADLSKMLKLINGANRSTAIVLISQSRNKITTWGAMQAPTGGQSLEFYSTTCLKLWASKTDKEQIKQEINRGGRVVQSSVGREVTWTIEYNKAGPPSQTSSYDFYYDGPSVGVDVIGEAINLAIEMDIVKKSGGWYYFDEHKIQGKDNVINYFKGNIDEFEDLKKRIKDGNS